MRLLGILLLLVCAATQPLMLCAKPGAVSARGTGHGVEFRWPATRERSGLPAGSEDLEVRTFITEADGRYRFGQLASDVDYQLWAEFKGHKSKTRAISSFDSKKQFNFDLKVETK